VLVLLPTDSNKLLLQWQGPFEVLERVIGDDYRIQLAGRAKTCHANMLKKYWNWERKLMTAVVNEPEEGCFHRRARINKFVRILQARKCS